MKKITLFLFLAGTIIACNRPSTKVDGAGGDDQDKKVTSAYANPVLPGDFADPSVVRVGDDYYATATSSEWAPLYPILHSTDLVNWEIVSHVFPESIPDWAEARFWAPEISYENGKYYIYYTAKKKDGPLCTAVASATDPEGPYTDHGPLICQEVGAIDGFAIRDENNDLYLIWKEDGNSRDKPTPIWGQQMNEERTALLGEKFELFRNDPNTWEGNLVEGAYITRRGDYYYAFYSGDRCCGRPCTYGIGVARAKDLRGPWEKFENNPLMKQNEDWKCAGHGSMVTDQKGNDYFLYHAYSTNGHVYTGRQGLLDKIEWGEDNWPHFAERAPSEKVEIAAEANERPVKVKDDFSGSTLALTWQWPVGQDPKYTLSDEGITLQALPEDLGAVLAQRTLSPDYTATVTVDQSNLFANARAGLTAIGDTKKAVGVALHNNKVVLWYAKGNEKKIIAEADAPDTDIVQLRLITRGGDQMEFAWRADGDEWHVLNQDEPVDTAYLPPWDRAVRVGLTVKGPEGLKATFRSWKVDFRY
ncbi:MAG: family 43 glycosylhydrolase [Fulvivirga sp.]